MKRETAEKAADWWAYKLENCAHHDNGAHDYTTEIAMIAADALALKYKPTEEQLENFKKDLIEALINAGDRVSLVCDYHPGYILKDVAKKNNINELSFPYKTSMDIENDTIYVKNGYGASYIEI